MLSTIEQLKGARELLSDPARWTKGAWARGPGDEPGFGSRETIHSPIANCWCLRGALRKVVGVSEVGRVTGGEQAVALAYKLTFATTLELEFDPHRFSAWNDREETTHEEVLALLDRAIAMEEKANV